MKRLAKEKTGREVLGSRLFAGDLVLARYFGDLPVEAAKYLRSVRKLAPDLAPDQLRRDLHAELGLVPLSIGDLLSIKLEVNRRRYLNDYDSWMESYLAEAIVPYSGSRLFWQWQPNTKFELGFPGFIGRTTVRLRGFVDHKDYDRVERIVEEELTGARKVLNAQAGEMVILELKAREELDRVADEVLS